MSILDHIAFALWCDEIGIDADDDLIGVWRVDRLHADSVRRAEALLGMYRSVRGITA